jgi:PhnB protein
MANINPHIHFNGNTEEAFEFYKSIFGGSFTRIVRYKDLPGMGYAFPEKELNKIMHISLPIGGSSVLTGSDVPDILGKVSENENRSKITISAESKEEADSLFNSLSAGGNIEYPMDYSPWGSYFGAFRDKYGIEWMIDFPETLKK